MMTVNDFSPVPGATPTSGIDQAWMRALAISHQFRWDGGNLLLFVVAGNTVFAIAYDQQDDLRHQCAE
jgi:hypothetical protein